VVASPGPSLPMEILVLHPIRDSSLVVSEQTKQTQLDAYLRREPQKTLRVVIMTGRDMCKRFDIYPFQEVRQMYK
jgi:hypothetical protein